MADKTQSWAERTVEVPPEMYPPASDPFVDAPDHEPATQLNFQRGRASVTPRAQRDQEAVAPHEPTGTGWPDSPPPPPAVPLRVQLRRGREWAVLGTLFSFTCWGIWAISNWGNLFGSFLTYVVTAIVAVGVFLISRLVGRVILERQLGRVRHSARGAYLITAAFLICVGFAYLRQTEWVMDVWSWGKSLFY